MSRPCLDLEIGDTIANLMNLRDKGIQNVDEWTYSPYSRTEIGGDGRTRGFGFGTASWSWDFMAQEQLNVFLDYFASASDASVALVIRTYQDSGLGRANMIGRFNAVMHRPIDGQGKTLVTESTLPVYSDVTIRFSRLESV